MMMYKTNLHEHTEPIARYLRCPLDASISNDVLGLAFHQTQKVFRLVSKQTEV